MSRSKNRLVPCLFRLCLVLILIKALAVSALDSAHFVVVVDDDTVVVGAAVVIVIVVGGGGGGGAVVGADQSFHRFSIRQSIFFSCC